MKRKRRTRLTTKMILLGIVPLFTVGVLVLVITSNIVYHGMAKEVAYSLEILSDTSYETCDRLCPGDYTLEKNVLKKGGVDVNEWFQALEMRKEKTGADFTFFYGDTRYLTTVRNENGELAKGTKASGQVIQKVLREEENYFSDKVEVNGISYFGYYRPLINRDGSCVGMLFVGKPRAEVMKNLNRNIYAVCGLVAGAMVIMLLLILTFGERMIAALNKAKQFLEAIAQGDMTAQMDECVLKRRDEVGEMGQFLLMLQKSIEELVAKDPLTGLANRRSCDVVLQGLIEADARKEQNFTVVMSDIDFFKAVNDRHGHQAGDEVLKMIAKLMQEHMEHMGFVFRWGGEEILMIYENMREEEARKYLVELQQAIQEACVLWKDEKIQITMTFGMTDNTHGYTPARLVCLADEHLYYGKEHGRNQIVGTREYTAEA